MQDTTKRTIGAVMLVVLVITTLILMYVTVPKKGVGQWISCDVSEISPDFTPAMREACRKARAENFNKDLQKPK